jgi:hypothetical protein
MLIPYPLTSLFIYKYTQKILCKIYQSYLNHKEIKQMLPWHGADTRGVDSGWHSRFVVDAAKSTVGVATSTPVQTIQAS